MAQGEADAVNTHPPSLEVLDEALEEIRRKLGREFDRGTLTDGEKKQAIRLCREAGRLDAELEALARRAEGAA